MLIAILDRGYTGEVSESAMELKFIFQQLADYLPGCFCAQSNIILSLRCLCALPHPHRLTQACASRHVLGAHLPQIY